MSLHIALAACRKRGFALRALGRIAPRRALRIATRAPSRAGAPLARIAAPGWAFIVGRAASGVRHLPDDASRLLIALHRDARIISFLSTWAVSCAQCVRRARGFEERDIGQASRNACIAAFRRGSVIHPSFASQRLQQGLFLRCARNARE
ncbi:hypothetical protein [Burkholderia sp. ABCPW 111]|uniref:hypothetical protein n=1 Tax=Burkholderia sp. ABCPW 111 TaxID=1820025 RepID=UPI00137840D4|nr:hypothetical protein [Burkholderia sp. ABCPW 111]